MTYTLSQMEQYVENRISGMNDSINYTKKLTEYDREWKIRHALCSVDREYSQGLGALHFAGLYLGEIEDGDFDRLNDKLFEAWKKANERVFLEIK